MAECGHTPDRIENDEVAADEHERLCENRWHRVSREEFRALQVEVMEREALAQWLVAEARWAGQKTINMCELLLWLHAEAVWHRDQANAAFDTALLTNRDEEVAQLAASRGRAVAEAERAAEIAHARWVVGQRLRGELAVAGQRAEVAEADAEQWRSLTPQQCQRGVHAEWFVDSEHEHVCPWCLFDDARAETDRVQRERDDALFELNKVRNQAEVGINLECPSDVCTYLALDLDDLAEHSRLCHPAPEPAEVSR